MSDNSQAVVLETELSNGIPASYSETIERGPRGSLHIPAAYSEYLGKKVSLGINGVNKSIIVGKIYTDMPIAFVEKANRLVRAIDAQNQLRNDEKFLNEEIKEGSEQHRQMMKRGF